MLITNKNRHASRSLAIAVGAASLVLVGSGTSAAVLEEIVVTAEKRSRSVQDIPLSIKAFSGEDLQNFGMITPKDLGDQVPGLFTKTTLGDSAPTFTIRGIGLNDFVSNNNSPTSLYIDEIYQPFHPMAGFALFDIERVEVLKGPQGTLYGRNNTGGAIKFITQKPSEEFNGHARVDYGRFDTLEAEFAAGGALTDSINARGAVFTRQGGAWQSNRTTARTSVRLIVSPPVSCSIGESAIAPMPCSRCMGVAMMARIFSPS